MSVDATRWAWQQKLKPIPKIVLLSLADRANETGECFPSVPRLVLDTGAERKAIMRAIIQLEADGLLETIKIKGFANRYRLIGVEDRHGHQTEHRKPAEIASIAGSKEARICGGGSTQKGTTTSPQKGTTTSPQKGTTQTANQSPKGDYHQSPKGDSNLKGEPKRKQREGQQRCEQRHNGASEELTLTPEQTTITTLATAPAATEAVFHFVPESVKPAEPAPAAPAPKSAKGSRLTIEALPESWRQFASRYPQLNADAIWETFSDYWIAQPSPRGIKLDWFATWRNWIRREAERKQPTLPTQQKSAGAWGKSL